MSVRHVEERAPAPGGDGRGRREVEGRCGGRLILLKALDPSAGANYYQRAEEQGLRSGASHPGELLASGWISEESNTGWKIMGGGRKGGREEPQWKKVLSYFFFILGLYMRSFTGAGPPSLFSPPIPSKLRRKKKKKLQTMSRTDERTGAHKLTHTCQGGVYSQWRGKRQEV